MAAMLAALAERGDGIERRSMPIRSREEAEMGLPGGEAEQHPQGMTRSRPHRIYLAHDCGGVWRSDDNGRSWRHAICQGLYLPFAQSVECDPVNADVVHVIVSRAYDHLGRGLQGLYRSEDAGRTWRRVLARPEVDMQRGVQHNLGWAPTSVDGAEARRWYAGFAGPRLGP